MGVTAQRIVASIPTRVLAALGSILQDLADRANAAAARRRAAATLSVLARDPELAREVRETEDLTQQLRQDPDRRLHGLSGDELRELAGEWERKYHGT